MTKRLSLTCIGLWGSGILQMTAARGLFGHEPGAPWFDLGTGLWIVGGLSYCFLGAMSLFAEEPAPSES